MGFDNFNNPFGVDVEYDLNGVAYRNPSAQIRRNQELILETKDDVGEIYPQVYQNKANIEALQTQTSNIEQDITELTDEVELKANIANPTFTGQPSSEDTPLYYKSLTNRRYVDDQINNVINVANGKCKSYVFETEENFFNERSSIEANIGDLALIEEIDVPDYWKSGVNPEDWSVLETTKVPIEDYYTKQQSDALLNLKVDKEAGKELSTNDFTDAYQTQIDTNTTNIAKNSGLIPYSKKYNSTQLRRNTNYLLATKSKVTSGATNMFDFNIRARNAGQYVSINEIEFNCLLGYRVDGSLFSDTTRGFIYGSPQNPQNTVNFYTYVDDTNVYLYVSLGNYVDSLSIYADGNNTVTAQSFLDTPQAVTEYQGTLVADIIPQLVNLENVEAIANNAVKKITSKVLFAYGRDTNGSEVGWNMSTSSTPTTIPYRDGSGTFNVSTPQFTENVANKFYVDNTVDEAKPKYQNADISSDVAIIYEYDNNAMYTIFIKINGVTNTVQAIFDGYSMTYIRIGTDTVIPILFDDEGGTANIRTPSQGYIFDQVLYTKTQTS